MPSDNRDIQSAIQAGESERVEFKKIVDMSSTLTDLDRGKIRMFLQRVKKGGRFQVGGEWLSVNYFLNAVVHRDYTSPVDIQIKIFDNQSRTRNKLVAEAFYLTRDIEKYGSGFIRVRREIRSYPTMELAYSLKSGPFAICQGELQSVSLGLFTFSSLFNNSAGLMIFIPIEGKSFLFRVTRKSHPSWSAEKYCIRSSKSFF